MLHLRSTFVVRCAAVGLVLVLGGCASSLERADRLYEQRAYAAAAAEYESVLETAGGSQRDRALFHLALLHALPESPLHDASRARELLSEVARGPSTGPYRAQAALLLDFERRHEELRAEAERTRLRIESLEAESSRLESDVEDFQATTAALRAELEQLRRRAAECEEQLEKLKAIDLGETR